MNKIFVSIISGIALGWSIQASVGATLPLTVDGQAQNVPTLAPMLREVMPGVVGIAIDWSDSGPDQELNPAHREFRRFFNVPDRDAKSGVRAAASGVVIDAREGLIVTNNHMVEHAKKIVVTLANHQELKGEFVGGDKKSDIAIIRVSAKGLTAIPFEDSNRLEVGDFVVAIGNPFGTEPTITTGVVSALHRNVQGSGSQEKFIQTDAAINIGNSGGALVNLRGQLVGVNTAVSVGDRIVGVAIPTNVVRSVVDQLAKRADAQQR